MSRRDQSLYRRRRRIAAVALVTLVAAISLGLEAALGSERIGPNPAEIEELYLGAVPEQSLIGQTLMVRMNGTAEPGLVRQARRGEIGGVIVFPPPGQREAELRAQIRRVQDAAADAGRPRLLVAIDQEGGEVKRLPDGPPDSSAPELGESGEASEARAAGRATGRYLARLGINVDLAPVLDVPSSPASFMTTRAFGDDPRSVGELGSAFAEGLEARGVIPAVKHFPGLGRAVANTDLGPSKVDASKAELEDDLAPFREALARGVPMVMVGNAIYDSFDREAPAALSRGIVESVLRDRLGFEGVVISDDLGAGAIDAAVSERDAPVAAAKAGIDILLFAGTEDGGPAADALGSAVKRGELKRASLERSLVRILGLKHSLAQVGEGE